MPDLEAQATLYTFWSIQWNFSASLERDFFVVSKRDHREDGSISQLFYPYVFPFSYFRTYRLALHQLLTFSRSCKGHFRVCCYTIPVRSHKATHDTTVHLTSNANLEGPFMYVSLSFLQFLSPGYIFHVCLEPVNKMSRLGYYIHFYSELLSPSTSYKKIYVINWP